MTVARQGHTATLLPNGQVLVAGGYNCSNGCTYLSSAELYDPGTGTFTPTSSMTAARAGHTATLLPNGEVLVAGGQGNGGCPPCNYLASAEVYNPSTGTWTATGSMTTSRTDFTATLLHNGLVLVTGGDQADKSAELFDPHTGTWTATGSRAVPLTLFTTTLLPSGKVLVAGGSSCNPGCSNVADAELYDPSTGLWTPTGSLVTARQGHVAVLLPNGQVLVAGGYAPFSDLTSAELYNPSTGTWTATGDMTTGRYQPVATVLQNGQVLVAGGRGNTGALSSAELYSPGPAVTLSSRSLDFGAQLVNTRSVTQTVTLSNTGSLTLTVSSVALTGTNPSDFSESDTCGGASLAPNSTCTISASFAPTASGSRTATLSISDTAADSPQSIVLTGRGADTIITLDTTSLDFGTQRVGTTSATQTVTLHNTGPGSLRVAGLAMTGANAGDFTAPNTCTGASIAMGSSCTISVSFAPTGGGPRSANLSITDNALDSPQRVALTGNGLLPATNTPTETPTAMPANTPTATLTTPPSRSPTTTATATPTVGRSHPAPLLFILHVAPHTAVSGQFLTASVHTVPQAQVTITLRVLERRVVYRGRGKQRKRLVQMVALYMVQVQGMANSRGQFTRSLKITYQPHKPVQALLAASARIGRRTATGTTHVTIRPQRHQRKIHQR